MSERERGEDNVGDKRDVAWLEAKERGDSDLPALDPQRAAAYERLFELVGQLPDEAPPAEWNDEVLTSIRAGAAKPAVPAAVAPQRPAPPRRRLPRSLALAGAFAVAAAVLLWLLLRKPPAPLPAANELTVAVLHQEGMRADPVEGEAALGDVLTARIISTAADEVRIYRDDRELVVRCPVAGDARCKLAGRHHVVELPLDAPGSYRTVALRPAPTKPPSGDLQADLRDCGCNPITAPPVIVR